MARSFWTELYNRVLEDGEIYSPRGRDVLEVNNIMYVTGPGEHFDDNPVRAISLDYIYREFLWFLTGDGGDLRIANYAPIWKTCIHNGIINSNYGQYLFDNNMKSTFFLALDLIGEDIDTRRCWIPIFQSFHQTFAQHKDYPCTTGMGFSVRENHLNMTIHMRSQDLWHGAPNDEGACFLIQKLAQAYLQHFKDLYVELGTITHYIDNLHFYDRHIAKAHEAVNSQAKSRIDVDLINDMTQYAEFSRYDIERIFYAVDADSGEFSVLMNMILNIAGDYGINDTERPW